MKFDIIYFIFTLLISRCVQAVDVVKASSLLTCMDNSQFTASEFDVKFFPGNNTAYFTVVALSNIDVNVSANIQLIAYGFTAFTRNISFCDIQFDGSTVLCPFSTGHIEIQDQKQQILKSITDQVPGIAYTIPDLDARVRVIFYDSSSKAPLACVEAVLSNGKTVQTKYASWPIAAISGLGVVTSGFISVIGHSNTAAHIASNSMSLFVYFQSLAITSMMAAAKVPPIASAWAQNFQWSLGIVKVNVIQTISNWYLQATGGTPTDILVTQYLSISVQKKIKRSISHVLDYVIPHNKRSGMLDFVKRISISLDNSLDDIAYSDNLDSSLYTTDEKDSNITGKILVLRGIQRVAYLAGIEITSLFMTGIIFLLFFTFIMIVCLTFFKALIEILIRSKIMNEGKFNEYRQQWTHIVKGALYRLLLLALPQITVLCFWEFSSRDSAGIIVIAVFLLIVALVLLCQAAVRVIYIGRKSVRQFKNPAYLLFGNGTFLNQYGFIYVQYKADCYYFIAVSLLYVILKSLFVAVLQHYGRVVSVIIFAIELVYLIILCWIKPFMDGRTNAFNISISVIGTINALFFMFFSSIFNEPHIVSSIMGIVYFILNAVFALFLLIFTIVTCALALIYKNPDTRYQPMKDDRVSFLPRFETAKGQDPSRDGDLELMALGATAMRGHENGGKPVGMYDENSSVYDDDDSSSYRFSNDNEQNRAMGHENSTNSDDLFTDAEPIKPTTIVGNANNIMDYNTAYNANPYEKRVNFN